MDRELVEALPHLPQLPFSDLTTARSRFGELIAQAPPLDRTGVTVEDRTVPGPQGAPYLTVRVFTPADRRRFPAGRARHPWRRLRDRQP